MSDTKTINKKYLWAAYIICCIALMALVDYILNQNYNQNKYYTQATVLLLLSVSPFSSSPYFVQLFQGLSEFLTNAQNSNGWNSLALVLANSIIPSTILLVLLVHSKLKATKERESGAYEPIPASITPKPVTAPISIKLKQICLYCGAEIPKNTKFCPRCGEARARCTICNEVIIAGDQLNCPYCGILSHRDHLIEWVRVKGYCPNCGQKLKVKYIA